MPYANNTNEDISGYHSVIMAAIANGGVFGDDFADIFTLTKTLPARRSNTSSTSHRRLAMDEATFKAAYIAQFIASYMAQRYDMDCQTGHVGKPYEHQPIEDAVFLANEAWMQIEARSDERAFGTIFKF